MRLENKVAIVTGGGTGIGKAAAIRFAEEGAKVVISGRRPEPLNETAAEINAAGGNALALPADVGLPDDTQRLIQTTVDHFGALHVLFNNAATTDLIATANDMTVEQWDRCIDVTLRSVFLMAKYAAPEMKEAGSGSIINCGSVGGIMPWNGGAAYCAAKSGMLALTKTLAIEYGPWNVRVNTLSPGAIMTGNLKETMEKLEHKEQLLNKSPLHRIGLPVEIANATLFLASDEASFVTAANLLVDGGYLTM